MQGTQRQDALEFSVCDFNEHFLIYNQWVFAVTQKDKQLQTMEVLSLISLQVKVQLQPSKQSFIIKRAELHYYICVVQQYRKTGVIYCW